jgi:DNA-binding transcriptional LysR family regulator
MLDVHRLRVFRSVVSSGSIAAAAANLSYTPSAVSQHVAALQRETGLSLLERVGRGVRPTAAGLAVAAQAEAILARIGEAETVISDLREGRTGRLSLAYFASVGVSWLPDVARRLTSEFPGVTLELLLQEDLDEQPDARPDIQLLVADKDSLNLSPEFEAHHLVDDPYVAVLPVSHTLAARAQIELIELAGERWVDNDSPASWCRRNLLDACATAGFVPPFQVRARDYGTAIAFVSAGMGITILPALGAQQLPVDVVAVPIEKPTPVRSIYAIVRKAALLSPPARLALDALASLIPPQPRTLPEPAPEALGRC